MVLSKLRKLSFCLISAITLSVAMISPVSAADRPPTHIQLSPGSQRIVLEPGKKTEGTFKVQNVGTKELSYRIYATPFEVTDNKYSLTYDRNNVFSEVAKWITFSQDTGKLDPNKTDVITYTVDVPNDAPGGSQRAALMAEVINDGQGTVNAVSRIGMLLYADMNGGDTRIEGKITDVKFPTFLFSNPVSVESLLTNTGNVDLYANITMTVRDAFSDELLYSNDHEPTRKNILADTKYFNSTSWDSEKPLGIYKVSYKIELVSTSGDTVDDETNPLELEKIVIICPLWLIFIILAIILFCVFQIVSRIKKSKSAKKVKSSRSEKE